MTRFLAFASVAAIFLSGIAIGALGMHIVHARLGMGGPFGPPHHPHAALEEIDRRLELSPDQREKIAAILEEAGRQGEAIRRELKPRFDAHVAETEQRVMEVLTPGQREKLRELHRERHDDLLRFFLQPPGPPPPPPGGAGGAQPPL